MSELPTPSRPPIVHPQIVGAQTAGIEPEALATAAGLPELDLTLGPELGDDGHVRLWRAAAQLADDPAIALHAAEAVPYGAFDVLDYIPSNSGTVRSGLEAVVRYFKAAGAAFQLELEASEASSSLRTVRRGRPNIELRRFSTEFTFACVVMRLRPTAERSWSPLRMHVAHGNPGYPDEYARIFNCPVHYDAACDELVFSAETLALRQPNADERLRLVLERGARDLDRWFPSSTTVSERLRRALAEEIRGRSPRLESAAKRLAMSPRTLHRRLAAESTSFKAELDAVRSDMAAHLLLDPELSVAEVAYVLGFAEVSAFSRAFRRWHDLSPAAWRRARAVNVSPSVYR